MEESKSVEGDKECQMEEGEVTRGNYVRKMLFDHGPEGNERVSKSEYLGEGCFRQREKTLTHIFSWMFKEHNKEAGVAMQVWLCSPTAWFKF